MDLEKDGEKGRGGRGRQTEGERMRRDVPGLALSLKFVLLT